MERDDLLPRHTNGREQTSLLRHGERERRDVPAPAAGVHNMRGTLLRQAEVPPYHSTWVNAEFDTAFRTDVRANLVAKANRWKMLAGEPVAQGVDVHTSGRLLQTGCCPTGEDLDNHEVAAMYVKDALAGRECVPCIRDKTTLNALKLVRNKTWNKVLNVCTIMQLALPMLEVQRCLPCFGPQKISYLEGTDLLHIGWRLTPLGSMWLECVLCCLYMYDIYLVILANGGGRTNPRSWWWHRTKLPRWQIVRTWLVFILALGLLTNMCSHYLLRMTWHRWSRVTLPFLLISRRTYLKVFVGGVIRVLPGMVPVVFLMSFVVFFYAFMGYVLYRTAPRDPSFLSDLSLFEEPLSSALTFLRMFMSIPFMMDVEILYYGNKGVQAMSLSYGVIMVIFLGALVPAVANRNFQNQSKESFIWMNEQRKIALTRAYLLMSDPANSMVDRKNWVRLMSFVNPDCGRESALALFKAAREADGDMSGLKDENRISKAGFFMMCALGKDRFESMKTSSPPESRRPSRAWDWLSKKLKCLLDWPNTDGTIPLSEIIYFLAILVQGYQIVREGDDPSESPPWTYALGAWLIAYFTLNACCQMVARGPLTYMMTYRHALDLALSIVGVVFYCGFWIRGEQSRRVYHILQAVRIVMLWGLLRGFRRTAEVAERLELVFPDLVRSSFVLFSVTYSYSIVAYALYCRTPLGQEPLGSVGDHSMVKRWAAYQDVGSFGSMFMSFASMTDVIMLSNWPMFMDAAGDVGNATLANIVFFSFKGLTFYFVMPVMLGFIVKSYMAAQLSSQESGSGGEGLVRDRTASSMSSTTGIRRFGLNGEDRPGHLTTLAGGHGRDIDGEEDSDCEEDLDCVVKVTERKRTMSTTFWGGEHANQDSANVTGNTLTSLEDENCRLRLRVEQLEMENRTLLDEQSRSPLNTRSMTPIVEAKEEEEDVAV